MGKKFYVNEIYAEHTNCMAKDGLVTCHYMAKLAICCFYPYFIYNFYSFKCMLYWNFNWTEQLQDEAYINYQYPLFGKYAGGGVSAEVLNFPRFQGCLELKNCVERTKKTPFSAVSSKNFT